ncbi:unnamed protein product [Rotaria socialis]|uniref:ADP ribosyltransferase domain-containing protein n=1 Tax=Rotaria socialis TaxID=392032 RepID=A0A821KSB1_9BILA|nr:unnamed protein product [Rotaria socialis]CAF4739411.1 unnamed protein product [Rotaria socialis]
MTETELSTSIKKTTAFHNNENGRRYLENFIVVWLDSDTISLKTVSQLREIVNSVQTFDNADECVNYLTGVRQEKVFFIISEELGEELVPLFNQLPQVKYIYVLRSKNELSDQRTQQYYKVCGLYETISLICAQMKHDACLCSNDLIAMSVIAPSFTTEQENNKQEATFMYSQLLNEVLLEIETTELELDDLKMKLLELFREQYDGSNADLLIIDEFQRDYTSDKAIWWYTRECFLYRILNKALRIQDTEILYKLRFFIKDVHLQIKKLYSQSTFDTQLITVYRGQGMSNDEFENLRQNVGGLLSIHSFWSTSLDPQVPSLLVPSNDPDMQGVLFKIIIDLNLHDATYFANIALHSHFQIENEILFSMGSVFRILSVSKNTDNTWVVCIKLSGDEDVQLKTLREHMKKQIGGTKMGEYNLAKLLRLMGKYDEQERFFEIMLSDLSLFDDMPHVLAIIYNDLAGIYKHRRDFKNALNYYYKSLEIDEKHLPPTDQTFANLYNNIGSVHSNQGNLDQALVFLEKSLKIALERSAQDQQQIASTYNNIAEVYRKKDDHENSLKYHQLALNTAMKSLPSNHPSFSITYSNMGGSYYEQKDYEEALNYFNKALNIKNQCLPANHHSYSITYGNIALTLHKLGRNEEAFNNMVKAIEIASKTLSPEHPHLKELQDDFEMICEDL